MSYLVLARKWRPQVFEDVVGQEHVTRTLTNAIRQKRIAHAYLFAGPRGVGKTTTARLLAKALNCEKGPAVKPCNQCSSCNEIAQSSSLDVVEIDGASNRGIDDIRSLRENVKFAPSRDRLKIYIVDEVHMLTSEAFNALLKTLEEPPEHVKFIFATTAPHRVLPTILSRCQRFDFRRISVHDMVGKLSQIAKDEKLDIEEKALFTISRGVEGSMRDALSLLDQLISFSEGKIRSEEVNDVLGMVNEEIIFSLAEAMVKGDILQAIKLVDKVISHGKDLQLFTANLMEYFRNLMMFKVGGEAVQLVDLPEDSLEKLKAQTATFSLDEIEIAINTLSRTANILKWSESGRIPLELAVIKLTKLKSLAQEEIPVAAVSKKAEPMPKKEKKAPVPVVTEEANPSSDSLSLETVKKSWLRVLSLVKEKKITAEAYLREATPTKVSNKMLTITFPADFAFHKESVERNATRRVIENILRDVFGHDLMLNAILDKNSSSGERKVQTPAVGGATVQEDDLTAKVSKDPVIKEALDLFGAKVVKVKKKGG